MRARPAVWGLSAVVGICMWMVGTAVPVTAHHAFAAEFDADSPVEFSGTVSKVEWINPHVWIHIDVARDLFQVGEGVHGIQAMTRDPLKIEPVLNAIMESVGEGMIVRSWKEQNRTLFATLEVEKNIIFLIVLCIAVVAAFSICNTLITVVVQKTREIGLLKAVGFAPGHILRVFLCMGWVLGITGTVFGFGLGLTVLRFRNDLLGLLNRKLDFELLPSEYYHLTEIPSTTTVEDSLLVVVCVMVVCTVAALVPAYRAARLDPASALRYE